MNEQHQKDIQFQPLPVLDDEELKEKERFRYRPDDERLHPPEDSCLLSPRFLTIHVPKELELNSKNKNSSVRTGPPKEIVIGDLHPSPPRSLPRTIEVKGSFTLPTEIVVVETKKDQDKDRIPDVIQVSSNLKRELAGRSHSSSTDSLPARKRSDHRSLMQDANLYPRHRTTNTRPKRGDDLDDDVHDARIRIRQMRVLGDDSNDARSADRSSMASFGPSERRRNNEATDPPAAKADTTKTLSISPNSTDLVDDTNKVPNIQSMPCKTSDYYVLPNFTDLVDVTPIPKTNSMPTKRKNVLDDSCFNKNHHPAWPVVHNKPLPHRANPPHWLEVTGTAEHWIQPEKEAEPMERNIAAQRFGL